MAKRLTDSRKWQDPWFRKLPPPYREFWTYLLDTCDHAGIWKVDFDMAEFCLGEAIDRDKTKELFNGRLLILKDEKWFIPKYLKFQYGRLRNNNSVHASVIETLKKNGLMEYAPEDDGKMTGSKFENEKRKNVYTRSDGACVYCGKEISLATFQVDHLVPSTKGGDDDPSNLFACCCECNRRKVNLSLDEFIKVNSLNEELIRRRIKDSLKGLQSPFEGAKDKRKDKNKDKVKVKDSILNTIYANFEIFWKAYPRKVARAAALKVFKGINPDSALLEAMLQKIDQFRQTKGWQEENGKFIPHPATWLNQRRWEDEIEIKEVPVWMR